MNVRKLFAESAKSMLAEFRESAEAYSHAGERGEFREEILKKFLRERIPARFAVGNGQIVGASSPDSRQSDVILYDTNICAPLVGDPKRPQIYPAEGVSGIIEVKSALSKAELIDGLEKIADFKRLVPKDNISVRHGGMHWSGPREHPFGAIFAYTLADNSLESLKQNLIDHEKSLDDRGLTANVIAVLDQGLITHKHRQTFNDILLTDQLREQPYYVSEVQYKGATLFEFYAMLMNLLVNTQLEVVDLNKYRIPVERLGKHIVRNHDRLVRAGETARYRLTANFIDGVVNWCANKEKLSSNELNRLITPDHPDLSQRFGGDGPKVIYLYNPNDLPSPTMEMISSAVSGRMETPSLINPIFIEIDGEQYAIPAPYTEGNTEVLLGVSWDDP
jgi:hypothetical protein